MLINESIMKQVDALIGCERNQGNNLAKIKSLLCEYYYIKTTGKYCKMFRGEECVDAFLYDRTIPKETMIVSLDPKSSDYGIVKLGYKAINVALGNIYSDGSCYRYCIGAVPSDASNVVNNVVIGDTVDGKRRDSLFSDFVVVDNKEAYFVERDLGLGSEDRRGYSRFETTTAYIPGIVSNKNIRNDGTCQETKGAHVISAFIASYINGDERGIDTVRVPYEFLMSELDKRFPNIANEDELDKIEYFLCLYSVLYRYAETCKTDASAAAKSRECMELLNPGCNVDDASFDEFVENLLDLVYEFNHKFDPRYDRTTCGLVVNPEAYIEANHKDLRKSNNSIFNLELVSGYDNRIHAALAISLLMTRNGSEFAEVITKTKLVGDKEVETHEVVFKENYSISAYDVYDFDQWLVDNKSKTLLNVGYGDFVKLCRELSAEMIRTVRLQLRYKDLSEKRVNGDELTYEEKNFSCKVVRTDLLELFLKHLIDTKGWGGYSDSSSFSIRSYDPETVVKLEGSLNDYNAVRACKIVSILPKNGYEDDEVGMIRTDPVNRYYDLMKERVTDQCKKHGFSPEMPHEFVEEIVNKMFEDSNTYFNESRNSKEVTKEYGASFTFLLGNLDSVLSKYKYIKVKQSVIDDFRDYFQLASSYITLRLLRADKHYDEYNVCLYDKCVVDDEFVDDLPTLSTKYDISFNDYTCNKIIKDYDRCKDKYHAQRLCRELLELASRFFSKTGIRSFSKEYGAYIKIQPTCILPEQKMYRSLAQGV